MIVGVGVGVGAVGLGRVASRFGPTPCSPVQQSDSTLRDMQS